MPTLSSIRQSILYKLNDSRQQQFTVEAEIDDAITAELRYMLTHSEMKPEFLAAFYEDSDSLEIEDDGVVSGFNLTDALKIVGGFVGINWITDVYGPNYQHDRHETIRTSTTKEWRIVISGDSIKLLGGGVISGDKVNLRYIADPPNAEMTPPALIDILCYGAAARLASNREQAQLANLRQTQREHYWKEAMGIRAESKK